MPKTKKLKITLKRSMNKTLPNHKKCVKGLGLHRMHESVVLTDDACIRGMVNKINYLLSVEEV